MNALHILLISIACFGLWLTPADSEVDVTRYNEGKHQFELLRYKSEMPRYGQCWVNAMAIIQAGCKRLTDETQTRLALAYLNCFLELQGGEQYPCTSDMTVGECTKPLLQSDRSSFTTFFTHTQNMCYFLQSQIWHQETELTISRLSDQSSKVANQLETAHHLQEAMLYTQNQSLKNQEHLIDGTHNLRGIINSSSVTIRSLFEDLKSSTLEQRQLIGDVFDQLLRLQSTIFGEVSSFYSLFHYILSLLVCYILTSTARTSGARLWLFVAMTVNIVMEQTVLWWLAGDKADGENLYWLQLQSRRFFYVVALVILCTSSFLYQDVSKHNNQLLNEIRKQNSDLKRFVSGLAGTNHLASGDSGPAEAKHLTSAVSSDEDDDDNDPSEWSDDDDDGESDMTYVLEETRQSEDESQGSGDEDGLTNTSSLFCELDYLKRSTPVRELNGNIQNWLNNSHTEASQSESPLRHSYNLRSRQAGSGNKTSPALSVESPKSFSRTVRQLEHISHKNSRLLRAELGQRDSGMTVSSMSPPQIPSSTVSSRSRLSSSSLSSYVSPRQGRPMGAAGDGAVSSSRP